MAPSLKGALGAPQGDMAITLAMLYSTKRWVVKHHHCSEDVNASLDMWHTRNDIIKNKYIYAKV
ncbi:hypothetical protein DVH24_001469 [Malus domestica]|uniref:Uncharacterized protein n=1 Tax=Malus domestica TaxID=3750 RepID=A0A498K5J2_MALDO|nr:hypothetical protein DVH24_001469 [Malus domestica]